MAIFDRLKGKAKRDEDTGKGASNRPSKKKNKQRCEGSLVAAVDRKGGQKPTVGTPDHFETMSEPCFPRQASIQGLRSHEAVLV